MFKDKTQIENSDKHDLRGGIRGSLTQLTFPLVGGEPMYSLQDPPLATPSFRIPPGQATHE